MCCKPKAVITLLSTDELHNFLEEHVSPSNMGAEFFGNDFGLFKGVRAPGDRGQ
jgi:hypothetical protein